jgi:hypothetical protein
MCGVLPRHVIPMRVIEVNENTLADCAVKRVGIVEVLRAREVQASAHGI